MNAKRLYRRPDLLMAEVLRRPRQPMARPSERDLALLQDQRLRNACGFCATAKAAAQLQRRLLVVHGLATAQVCVLAPGRPGRRLFQQLVVQWQAQRALTAQLRRQCSPLAGVWLGMALGGLLAAAWLVFDTELSELVQLGQAAIGVLGGGVLGWLGSAVAGRRRPGQRFDRAVLRHLAAGEHGVVVHGVPLHQQAAVLGCLQDNSRVWCAEAADLQKLG